jgi:hypoxanthine phosphoribosyltransferase
LPARVLVGSDELHAGVRRLAGELSAAYDDDVVLVAVLKGSVVFLADLLRAMTIRPVVDFLAISTYAPGSGRVRLVKDLDVDIGGRHVVLLEDIVDTGLSLAFLRAELARREPATLAVCTLLDRPARRILPAQLDYTGFQVPDVFVLGYGLDFAGRYRNLDLLAAGDVEALAADPDVYVDELYGRGAASVRPDEG